MKRVKLLRMTILIFGAFAGSADAQSAVYKTKQPDTSQQPDTARQPDKGQLEKSSADSLPLIKHPHRKRSHFEVGSGFQSDDVYLGRKDSTALPYYIPAVSFYHKSGLYATASLSYLKNATASRIDLVTLEGGYMFSAKKYDGLFTVSKYFYNSQSTSVSSEINSSVAYHNSYDLGFIKPAFTGTLNIGNKLDFSGLFEISHTFSFFDENLEFSPTFGATASTQNYYNDYYRTRRYTVRKKKQVVQTGIATVTGTVLDASTFRILDYEAGMPVEYTIGKCTISFSPTYSLPVNPASVSVRTQRDDGTVINKKNVEKIGNTFYFTLGVSFLF